MRTHTLLALTCTLLAGAACSTTTPIGEIEKAGAPGSVSTGVAGTTGAAGTTAAPQGHYVPTPGLGPDDQPFTNPADVSGDWVGYFENYTGFGSDAVRFHFGVDAAGNGTISVKLGDGVVPPPPTDAFQAWPDPVIDANGGPGKGIAYPTVWDGFTYAAHEVKWQGRRLKLSLFATELWAGWCGLQTSYRQPGSENWYTCDVGGGYICSAGGCVYSSGPSAGSPADRNHSYMCTSSGICDCNATGCGPSTSSGRIPFDLTFFADHAYGGGVQLFPEAP